MRRFEWLRNRSTSDLLVLMIAGTICFSVLSFGAIVAYLAIAQPEESHSSAVLLVTDTLQMLVSLLAGFIAGRTEAAAVRQLKEDARAHEADQSADE
jgi:hypothetical protein